MKTKNNGDRKLLTNDQKEKAKAILIRNIESIVSKRSQFAQGLGISYGMKRDLYKTLGYIKNPEFSHYWNHYTRNTIAKRIINAYPDACWFMPPKIYEDNIPGKDTAFEAAWKTLVVKKRLFHYFQRVDKLASIGEYGVLLIGVDDGKELKKPLKKASKILYLQPYGQDKAFIDTWNVDVSSERYGLPEIYKLRKDTDTPTNSGSNAAKNILTPLEVNHTRIIHVAEDLLDSDVFGLPKLQSVLNMLQNLETVAGSSGEMFWRGAFPGLAFKAEADAQMDADQGMTSLEEEIDAYVHDLQRHIKLQGIDVEQLIPRVVSPENFIDVYLNLISGATAIPKRILIGSERGELASTQDETAWNNRVLERQKNFCEPIILRPFIERMIELGILPEPKKYNVVWKKLFEPTESEKAQASKLRVEALAAYVTAVRVDKIVPVEIFLEKYLDFTQDEIEQAKILSTTSAFSLPEPEPVVPTDKKSIKKELM